MLDTLAVAQEMTAGGINREHAEVIANAIRKVAEQGDHVTADQFKAGIAELRTEIAELRAEQRTEIAEVRTEIANLDTRLSTQVAGVRTEIGNLETRLIKWIVGTVLTTVAATAAIAGAVVGVLRLLSAVPVP